ncbi:hypothetical protein ACLK1S_06080 [Escherichia coli]
MKPTPRRSVGQVAGSHFSVEAVGGRDYHFQVGHGLSKEMLQLACGPLRFVRAAQNAA